MEETYYTWRNGWRQALVLLALMLLAGLDGVNV